MIAMLLSSCVGPALVAAAASLGSPARDDFDFATLTGRVLETDGAPLAGARVALLEFRGELTATFGEDPFDDVPAEEMRVLRAETTTASDGSFTLRRADPQRLHAIVVDLGGPRPAFRLVDQALEPSATTDLSAWTLAAGATLHGRVVDEGGAPIADARVRLVPRLELPLPKELSQILARDLEPGRALLSGAPAEVFLELPPWVREFTSRLPLPTATSAADGTFRFPHLTCRELALFATRRDHVGVVRDAITLPGDPVAGEHAADDLVLPRGRTVRGRLTDGDQPLSGAFVHAGAVTQLEHAGPSTIAAPLGASDAEGRFTLTGVPEGALTLVGVQRRAGGPIHVLGPFAGDAFDVAVPPTAALQLRVHDALGRPRPDAKFRFMLVGGAVAALRGFGLPHDFGALLERGQPGEFTLSGLPLGSAVVLARTDDSGWESAQVKLLAGGATQELKLPVAAPRRVRVVAARDGSAVVGASVLAIARTPRNLGDPLGFAVTDAVGRATITTLRHDHALVLRVSHPGYCSTIHPDPVAAGSDEFVVELPRGGALTGRLPVNLAASPTDWTVAATWAGQEMPLEDRLPRFAVAAADGSFRIPALRPGPWEVSVHPRLALLDPARLLFFWQVPPSPEARGTGQVVDGAASEVTFAVGR
jgi:hypothetical protein